MRSFKIKQLGYRAGGACWDMAIEVEPQSNGGIWLPEVDPRAVKLRKAFAPTGLIFNLLTVSQGDALCYS